MLDNKGCNTICGVVRLPEGVLNKHHGGTIKELADVMEESMNFQMLHLILNLVDDYGGVTFNKDPLHSQLLSCTNNTRPNGTKLPSKDGWLKKI